MAAVVSVFAGCVLGFAFGALRELTDLGFRTRGQVESLLDTECLALVPALPELGFRQLFVDQSPQTGGTRLIGYAGTSGTKTISAAAKVLRPIFDLPSSPYAEAIRSIKLAIDLNEKSASPKVIGLTSCLPSEGKSTIAASLAGRMAKSGARVILIDGDLRNPSLSGSLAPDARVGLLEAIAGQIPIEQVVWTEPLTKMEFLPTIANSLWPNSSDLLTSSAGKSLFVALQLTYDYVIVDLPPLAAASDVRAAGLLVDSYLLVIEWGATKTGAVQYALRNTPGFRENILGAVLNKVDIDRMSHYDRYGSTYYYGGAKTRGDETEHA
jgi:polysaccharide biosynthesis transport protein